MVNEREGIVHNICFRSETGAIIEFTSGQFAFHNRNRLIENILSLADNNDFYLEMWEMFGGTVYDIVFISYPQCHADHWLYKAD